MGWIFIRNVDSKEQIIDKLTTAPTGTNFLKKSVVGNHLWIVCESESTKKREILLYLLGTNDGNWGYKDLSENDYPYYYDCPLSFFKLAPNPETQNAKRWRESVAKHYAEKNSRRNMLKSIDIGSVVRFSGVESSFTITSLNPLAGISNEGVEYRLPKRRILGVTNISK